MRGVFFDVDGTLLDSNEARAQAWAAALEGAGVSLPVARLRRELGRGGEDALFRLADVPPDSHEAQAIEARQRAVFRTLLPELGPTPGARELLLRLKADGFVRIAASMASGDETRDKLVAAGVADLVDLVVGEDDLAVERCGLPLEAAVLVGDAPWDVAAGKRAGVDVIGLRCGGFDREDLQGALAIYDDPADLRERYALSPLGRWAREGRGGIRGGSYPV